MASDIGILSGDFYYRNYFQRCGSRKSVSGGAVPCRQHQWFWMPEAERVGRTNFSWGLRQTGLPESITGLWLRSLETQPAFCNPSGGDLGEFLLPASLLALPPAGHTHPKARGQGDPRVRLVGLYDLCFGSFVDEVLYTWARLILFNGFFFLFNFIKTTVYLQILNPSTFQLSTRYSVEIQFYFSPCNELVSPPSFTKQAYFSC